MLDWNILKSEYTLQFNFNWKLWYRIKWLKDKFRTTSNLQNIF